MLRSRRGWLASLLVLVICAVEVGAQEGDLEVVRGATALAATIEATGPLWFDAVEQAHPARPDLQAFAELLIGREDIADAEALDDTVSATTVDGIAMRFTAPPPGVLGTGGALARTPARFVADVATSHTHAYGDLVPRGKALVIHGYHSGYRDKRKFFRQALEQGGYTVEDRRGTPEDFAAMSEAAIIVVAAHGSVKEMNGTRRFMIQSDYQDDLSALLGEMHGQWYLPLKENEMGVYHRVQYDDDDHPVRSYWGVDIYDVWLEKNLESMVPNALVLWLTCHGADIDSPWSIFKARGAGAMLAFTGTVDTFFAAKWCLRLLQYVLGTSNERPSETAPLHRPWTVHDAFDRIISEDDWQQGYDWTNHANPAYRHYGRAAPVLRKAVAGPDNFSAAPHIDQAWVYRMPGSRDYTLALWGAFGNPQDCTLTIGGRRLQFEFTPSGFGTPWNASLPPNVYGDLVLTDGWGRKSNPVTVSEFKARIAMDYDDPYMAGSIVVDYTEPVVGARLYRVPSNEMVFAGVPAWNQDRVRRWIEQQDQELAQTFASYDDLSPGWPLVWGIGDVQISWDFDSVKTVDNSTYVTRDSGQRTFRATDMATYFGSHARLQVFVPPAADPGEAVCEALVSLAMQVELRNVTINGEAAEGPWRIGPDLTEAQTTYSWRRGLLDAVHVQGEKGAWKIEAVQLTPHPYNPDDRAALPRSGT